MNKFVFLLIILISALSSNADEIKLDNKSTEFNVYTGMFDFSDDGKRATLIGFQQRYFFR
jgi:lipid A 3-O-deacylase